MASKTINITYKVGGVLTDLDSLTFSDEDATYGVRRISPHAIVVAAGTAFTRSSTGTYTYTITGLTPGVEYEYWITRTFGGISTRVHQSFMVPASGTNPVARYIPDYDKFIRRWGLNNVTFVSNKDNKATIPNVDVVQDSFDAACDDIDDFFKGSIVASPLDFSPWEDVLPSRVERWAMQLAYIYMYFARGFEDRDKVGNKLSRMEKQTYQDMGFYAVGARALNAKMAQDSSSTDLSPAAEALVISSSIFSRNPNFVQYVL